MKTPYFILNQNLLQENIDSFKNALNIYWPNSQIGYSIKTNSLPWVLKYMKNQMVFAEAVSREEYELAKLCGYSSNEIIYNGPIKNIHDIEVAFKEGAIINIDSQKELKYIKEFKLMEELAQILKNKRLEKGYLNLDIPESKIELDIDGKVKNISKYETSFANEIIEQFMLSANEAVAEKFYWLEAPFIYRVHEKPDLEKIQELNKFLFNFGLKIKANKDNIHSKEFSKILEEVKGKEEEKVVSNLILRTLKLARYEAENKGHFGIASKYYCHFTSPIRRYPDLFIHRVISEYIENNYDIPEKWIETYEEYAKDRANQSSEREKIATKVERDNIFF